MIGRYRRKSDSRMIRQTMVMYLRALNILTATFITTTLVLAALLTYGILK